MLRIVSDAEPLSKHPLLARREGLQHTYGLFLQVRAADRLAG